MNIIHTFCKKEVIILTGIRTKHKGLLLLRTELGLTQQEFAKKIGISQAAYSAKETGKTPVTVPEAIRILQISGRRFEDVFLPEDYKNLVVEGKGFSVRPVVEEGNVFEVEIRKEGSSNGS